MLQILHPKRLEIIPQHAFLGHFRVNVKVTLSTRTHIVFDMVKDLCRTRLYGLRFAASSPQSTSLIIYCLMSTVCSLQSAVCKCQTPINFSSTLVNSQLAELVCIPPVGILDLVMFIYHYLFTLVLKSPDGEWPTRYTFTFKVRRTNFLLISKMTEGVLT